MSLANQLKKLDYCVGVNVGGASHGKNFASVAAYSAKHVVSLSSTCASNEDALETPNHSQKASQNKVHRIKEKDLASSLRGFFEPWLKLLREELELQLRIGLAWNLSGSAASHAHIFESTPRLFLAERNACEPTYRCHRLFSGRRRMHCKGASQARKKWRKRTAGAVGFVLNYRGNTTIPILFDVFCNGVGGDIEDSSDRSILNTFRMHSQSHKLPMDFRRCFRIIECLVEVIDLSRRKSQLDHVLTLAQ
jgi:hypothetical protein